jgi:hypothetical protein
VTRTPGFAGRRYAAKVNSLQLNIRSLIYYQNRDQVLPEVRPDLGSAP